MKFHASFQYLNLFGQETKSPYGLTRFCFQRALAGLYLIGFLVAFNQFVPLLGTNGLLPVPILLKKLSFWSSPSLFFAYYSDGFAFFLAAAGIGFSGFALSGWSEKSGNLVSALVWGFLWVLYLSFVNVGQTFYGFGWESMLLETGFLAIFMGGEKSVPPRILIWFLRWELFRVMFGAGLIKLRGDECWRDLTCLVYHYETQPIPNPLSWYFHHLPVWIHKFGVLYNHFVELVVPWFYFVPPFCYLAGLLTAIFQGILILSGNLSWLNYMTIVLCIPLFDDRILSRFLKLKPVEVKPASGIRKVILIALSAFLLLLSLPPAANLFASRQLMNASFDPLHLVNTYGAFGSITKKRMEIVLEGTTDKKLDYVTEWKAYEFKAKPGDLSRLPPLISPYHLRLDWLMWFAAMNDIRFHPWLVQLVLKLLSNDERTLSLLRTNPFEGKPPAHIRALLYEYEFTTPEEKKRTGQFWRRRYVREYLPPLKLKEKP